MWIRAAVLVLVIAACKHSEPQPDTQAPEQAAPLATYDSVTAPEPEPQPAASSPRPRVLKDDAPSNRPDKTIYRSEIERATQGGPGYLLYQLGPEPFRAAGKFVGWEITRLFPDDPSLCEQGCDLAVGDVILAINGDRLETPQAFSNMVAKAPKLKKLEVRMLRGEDRKVTTYQIIED
jgi:hypothetical protein